MNDMIATRDALAELLAPFQSDDIIYPVLNCTDPIQRFLEDAIRLAADRGRVEVAAAVLVIARAARRGAGRAAAGGPAPRPGAGEAARLPRERGTAMHRPLTRLPDRGDHRQHGRGRRAVLLPTGLPAPARRPARGPLLGVRAAQPRGPRDLGAGPEGLPISRDRGRRGGPGHGRDIPRPPGRALAAALDWCRGRRASAFGCDQGGGDWCDQGEGRAP